MSPQNLVSVIIPCHNAARWLAQTLASALAQTWPGKEIILVDDGSADQSLAIARGFESRGVQVLAQARAGAGAARNRGLRQARGEFIQFLDADDLLAPDKIARQMQLAAEAGPEAVVSGRWSRFDAVPARGDFAPEILCADFPPVDWVVAKFERHAMMHPAAWLTPRHLIRRAGLWDEELSLDDDGEFFTRLVLCSRGVRHCPEAESYYRSGLPGSLSRSNSEAAWASAFRALDLSSERLLQAEDSPRTRHACATAWQRYIFEAYPRAPLCRRAAMRRLAMAGGCHLAPAGGPKFQLARRLLGWRLAKRLRNLAGAIRN